MTNTTVKINEAIRLFEESKRVTFMAHAMGALIAKDTEDRRDRRELVHEAKHYTNLAMDALGGAEL